MTRLWLNSVSMPAHLVAENLRRSFKVGTKKIDVLRGISLSIEHGASVFLVGASGAGKTTLLYTLAGLERPEAGTVALNGTSLYTSSGNALARLRNQHMGFVFQSYFLIPELTALENVLVPPNTLLTMYLHGGQVDEILSKTDTATTITIYYHRDALGCVTALSDAIGGIAETYQYGIYGTPKLLDASGTTISSSAYNNRFLFTGREWIADLTPEKWTF